MKENIVCFHASLTVLLFSRLHGYTLAVANPGNTYSGVVASEEPFFLG